MVSIPVDNPNYSDTKLEEIAEQLFLNKVRYQLTPEDPTIYILPNFEIRCTGVKLADNKVDRTYEMSITGDLDIVIEKDRHEYMLRIPIDPRTKAERQKQE